MRAVQVVTLTGPSDVEVREVDPPTQGHDDVLVEVHSVGVSFPDLLLSRGEYQLKPEPPFALGVDFAGVVLDPGSPESSAFTVGQRVAGVNIHGGAAEQVANPAIFTFPLPETGIEPLLRALIEGEAGILSLSIERAGLHDAFVAIAGEAAAAALEAAPEEEQRR